jgi:signal transduction histidine kinase
MRRWWAAPVLLPCALLALALVELTFAHDLSHRAVAWVCAPLLTLPLVWRTRVPVAAGIAIALVFLAQTVAGVPANGQVAATIVVIVASFAIGRHAGPRHALAGIAAIAAIGITTEVVQHASAGDVAFVMVFVVASWLAGFALARRSDEASQLAQRAALAHAHADERAQEAVELERRRIARELHDTVAHTITVMVLQAGAADAVLERTPEQAREALREIQSAGRSALVDMRHLLAVLRADGGDDDLAPQPQLSDLPRLLEQLGAAGLRVSLELGDGVDGCPVSVSTSAYRVVREALTNTMRHGGPQAKASVVLRCDASGLDVEVTDDGQGVSAGAPGFGLVGMRERVAAFGGELHAGPRAGGGFVVRARFPLTEGVLR